MHRNGVHNAAQQYVQKELHGGSGQAHPKKAKVNGTIQLIDGQTRKKRWHRKAGICFSTDDPLALSVDFTRIKGIKKPDKQ
mmetsp:Transcript_61140/g.107042  ORF Transcript_61140/g.107042 Transcript_61140/m.107042 type:complete len:81 (-) Transcript_61140:914-1156(-)